MALLECNAEFILYYHQQKQKGRKAPEIHPLSEAGGGGLGWADV